MSGKKAARGKPVPRASVVRPFGLEPRSMAALVLASAWVWTGPPLKASGCRPRLAPKGRLKALVGDRTQPPAALPMALLVALTTAPRGVEMSAKPLDGAD